MVQKPPLVLAEIDEILDLERPDCQVQQAAQMTAREAIARHQRLSPACLASPQDFGLLALYASLRALVGLAI